VESRASPDEAVAAHPHAAMLFPGGLLHSFWPIYLRVIQCVAPITGSYPIPNMQVSN